MGDREILERMERALQLLREWGVEKVIVEFSGWGDSGAVDRIIFQSEKGEVSPESSDEWPFQGDPREDLHEEVMRAVEEFTYHLLIDECNVSFEGPGADGVAVIDTKTGKIFVEATNYDWEEVDPESGEEGESDDGFNNYVIEEDRIPEENLEFSFDLKELARKAIAHEIEGL